MIDFDHAASTAILPAIKAQYPALLEKYSGNAESMHQRGQQLKQALQQLENELFSAILPQASQVQRRVFFADSATTLINAAGMILGSRKSRALSSALDHPAAGKMIDRCFGRTELMPLDAAGRISGTLPENREITFIYLTLLQSEIGVLQDVGTLMSKLRKMYPNAFIMADAVQFAAFYSYSPEWMLPDALLISGAKLGSGSGAALLVTGKHLGTFKKSFQALRKDHLIARSDIVQAAALIRAAQTVQQTRRDAAAHVEQINRFLRKKLQDAILPNQQKVILTVPEIFAAGNILHLILPGYQSGVLVRMFSQKNILLASGSACAAETDEPSRILTALKYSRSDSYSGLRLSFAPGNTIAQAEIFLQTLQELLQDY